MHSVPSALSICCLYSIVPVGTYKNRMGSIFFQNGFDDSIRNILLIGKVAVKGCLTDPHRIGKLRDTACFAKIGQGMSKP